MGTALQKAQTDLTAAILLNPNSVEAHALMGEVQFAQGQLAAANQSYRKALEREPGLKEALLGLSQIALKRMDLPKAEELLRKATAANPRDWLCHYNLGAFLIDRGLLDEAEEVLRKAVALNEGQLSAPNTALAQLYLSRGEATAALMEGHRAIGIEKNAMNAYVLGKAYFEVEQNETASQYFSARSSRTPDFGRHVPAWAWSSWKPANGSNARRHLRPLSNWTPTTQPLRTTSTSARRKWANQLPLNRQEAT